MFIAANVRNIEGNREQLVDMDGVGGNCSRCDELIPGQGEQDER